MINAAAGYVLGKYVILPLSIVAAIIAHAVTGSGGVTMVAFFATFIGSLVYIRRIGQRQAQAELEAEERQATLIAQAIVAEQHKKDLAS